MLENNKENDKGPTNHRGSCLQKASTLPICAWWFCRSTYSKFTPEGVLANVLGILLVVFGVLLGYLITKDEFRRPPNPEEESLSVHFKTLTEGQIPASPWPGWGGVTLARGWRSGVSVCQKKRAQKPDSSSSSSSSSQYPLCCKRLIYVWCSLIVLGTVGATVRRPTYNFTLCRVRTASQKVVFHGFMVYFRRNAKKWECLSTWLVCKRVILMAAGSEFIKKVIALKMVQGG